MNENEQVIQDGTTADYLNNLVNDRDTMVTNLNTMGVPAEANETFTDLAQRILEIPQGDDIQYDTMPVPSIDYLDKIVQYVGETTLQEPIYTNGYFYKCISDGQDPATYSWENINVQTIPEYTIPLEVFDLTDSSTSEEIITALGGSDNIVKLREAFKNNKEINVIDKRKSGFLMLYTTTPVKYVYANAQDITEIIKLEAAYVANTSSADYKRHFIQLSCTNGTWSVSGVSVTDIATTELTGLLSNLQTTDKTNLVSAINEVFANGSPLDILNVTLPTDTYGLNLMAWDYCSALYSLKNEQKIYLLKYNSNPNIAAILFVGIKAPNGYSSQTIITSVGTDNGVTVATRYISNSNNNFYNNKRWFSNYFTLDQDASNGIISKNHLVQTITSSSNTYACPSAKAVYDLFNSITNANNTSY